MIAALQQKPAMIAEDMQDFALPPQYFIPISRAVFPDAPVIELKKVGHFCQKDQPLTLIALIEQFTQLT